MRRLRAVGFCLARLLNQLVVAAVETLPNISPIILPSFSLRLSPLTSHRLPALLLPFCPEKMKPATLSILVLSLAASTMANPVLVSRTNNGECKRNNDGGCEPEPQGPCNNNGGLICCGALSYPGTTICLLPMSLDGSTCSDRDNFAFCCPPSELPIVGAYVRLRIG